MAFSAHKMLGPTGIGVLYGKQELLEQMEPIMFGGEMINDVGWDRADWAELPYKFEAGTPHIAGAVSFGPALDYLERIGMTNIRQHEIELTGYILERLSGLDNLKIYGPMNPEHRGGAVAFTEPNIHPHDLSQFLDSHGIAVRAGHHCAQPLTRLLGVNATTRASIYVYNCMDDIDQLIDAMHEARRYFGHG
jgi:cysteine desulfurase/selenocysteine lyase